jgi:hypothetical protein
MQRGPGLLVLETQARNPHLPGGTQVASHATLAVRLAPLTPPASPFANLGRAYPRHASRRSRQRWTKRRTMAERGAREAGGCWEEPASEQCSDAHLDHRLGATESAELTAQVADVFFDRRDPAA